MLKFLIRFLMFIILAAVSIAILRVFGYDPMSLIEWVVNTMWGIIDRIATWLGETRIMEIFQA